MDSKPRGWSPQYAAVFADPDVVEAQAFATELRARIVETREGRDGRYDLPVRGKVTWGTRTRRLA